MSTIIAINPMGHDAGVAIVKDGRLVVAAIEERFTRVKHHATVPTRSLEACMRWAGLSGSEIDHVVIPFSDHLLAQRGRRAILDASGRAFRSPLDAAKRAYVNLPMASRRGVHGLYAGWLERAFRAEAVTPEAISAPIFVPHHLTHARHALSFSGRRDGAVLVADAQGELSSTSVFTAQERELRVVHEEPVENSLGYYYAAMTEHLGWERSEGEGKTMGLAPFGAARKDVDPERLVATNSTSWRVARGLTDLVGSPTAEIERITGIPRRRRQDALTPPFPDFAFAAQEALERAMAAAARMAMDRAGSRHLMLSGGVALNCKANMRIHEETAPESLYVTAAASDAGAVVGAALEHAHALGELRQEAAAHDAWGPDSTDEEIEALLSRLKIPFMRPNDIASEVAHRLARGEIVGWYQGRMELGPRSLGHRAVLADPRDAATRDRLNVLKAREAWRPLCPSILAEKAGEYFENATDAPFMILTFRVREARRKEIAAAVHVDGTTRPQTVRANVDPLYHRLISKFEREAGVPALLNTSFNVAGSAIVGSPLHALMDARGMGLDAVALGSFLVGR